ncbi:hypothetical protein FA10DRAFT_304950 [Acaromyces ingoldii]|uniref:Uncharacterized protein n=1 Tax=Acaromyces ingoldii TaxID=215250 RepID=A0A316YEH8_9BASI|nr:hypothetical protein FA10DRAFT_304950 [Acaromyces ingoldii]PWN86453.1 hypothetical protein FA10DRAFT_304950 [Acaromyces ingoldii]
MERDTPCTTDADCIAFRPSGVCCTQDIIDNDPFVLCAQNDVGLCVRQDGAGC